MSKKNPVVLWAVPLILAVLFQGGCAPQSSSDKSGDSASSKVLEAPAEPKPVGSAPVVKNLDGSFKSFFVYNDANSPDNHYDPSGWMGDHGDLKMSQDYLTNPHGGSSSIQLSYSAKKSQGAGWAGIYWQNPANNWGSKAGGYDLTGAKKLTFWIRGEKGGERIEEIKAGGITGEYPDSDVAGIGPVVLTTDWKQYAIDLGGKDLSSISGGFCWVASADSNPDGMTFYLDEVVYE